MSQFFFYQVLQNTFVLLIHFRKPLNCTNTQINYFNINFLTFYIKKDNFEKLCKA